MGRKARARPEMVRLFGTSWGDSSLRSGSLWTTREPHRGLTPKAPPVGGLIPAGTECDGASGSTPSIASRRYWPAIKAATCGVPIPVTGSQPAPAE